jgi:hypothetical protein
VAITIALMIIGSIVIIPGAVLLIIGFWPGH